MKTQKATTADKLKELIANVVKLRKENNLQPYTSLCSILGVDGVDVADGTARIKSKKIEVDDYLRTITDRKLKNIIAGLMSIDENYKYLTVAGAKKFRDSMIENNEHFDWIKKKINEHIEQHGRHISILLDGMDFINSRSSELSREFAVEEFLISRTEEERKTISVELTKLEARIKNTENAYDPEFSIGQGFEARSAAVALHIKVADLDAFVRNDMKGRDWAIRKVIEAVQGKMADLETKAAGKGLSMEKIIENALPEEGKTLEMVLEEIKKSDFNAALRIIQTTEDMIEKVEQLGQFAKQVK